MLKLGDKGIDYSAFRPPTPGDPNHWHACFDVRYSAGAGSVSATGFTKSKLISPTEFAGIIDAGRDVVANSEWGAQRVAEGGKAGAEDGIADHDLWQSCGLAKGAVIICSLEPGNDKAQWKDTAEYLERHHNAGDAYYGVGLYAGLPTLLEMRRRGVVSVLWLPMSSAASGLDTSHCKDQDEYAAFMEKVARDNGINLCQNRNRWYGVQADEDVITITSGYIGSHLQALAASGDTQPAPKPHKPKPKPAPKTKPKPAHSPHYDVRVHSGETLSEIAHDNHVSLGALEAANPQLGPPKRSFDLIHPGDVVHIPNRKPPHTGTKTYTVHSGDTLWEIAEKEYGSGTKWNQIYAHNKGVIGPNPDAIHPGMKLVIP